MMHVTKSLLFVAVLGLAACNNPDRYGAGGAEGAGGAGADGINTSGLGDAINPRSIAYFNQTLGDRVLFAVDQSSISDQARATLASQAQWLSDQHRLRHHHRRPCG